MVRPVIAPMAEAAADNVAIFFSEDIFIAFGSVLLIKAFLDGQGVVLQPLQLSVWAIPTAIAALAIHGTRLLLMDRKLKPPSTDETLPTEPAP